MTIYNLLTPCVSCRWEHNFRTDVVISDFVTRHVPLRRIDTKPLDFKPLERKTVTIYMLSVPGAWCRVYVGSLSLFSVCSHATLHKLASTSDGGVTPVLKAASAAAELLAHSSNDLMRRGGDRATALFYVAASFACVIISSMRVFVSTISCTCVATWLPQSSHHQLDFLSPACR